MNKVGMRLFRGLRPAAVGAALVLSLAACGAEPTDFSELESLLYRTSILNVAGYTEESVANLQSVYDEAYYLADDEEATQEQVDKAVADLQQAIDGLEEPEVTTDEFTIVEAHAEPVNEYGYFEMIVTVVNNTDSEKNFLGVDIQELDANGNIINSYMSYNKNAVDTIVQPGQQLSIPLTCAASDGIAGVSSNGYEYGDFFSGNTTSGKFSAPFKQMF